MDPKELEGRVIEHGQVVVQLGKTHTTLFIFINLFFLKRFIDVKPKRVIKKSNQYYGGDDFGRGYDPFRLVPTNHYNDDLPAPFEVEILSDALVGFILQFNKTKQKQNLTRTHGSLSWIFILI